MDSGMSGTAKRGYLRLLKNTLNRATSRFARSGHGPFSLVRHVGRKTGTVYETPIILARTRDGFVAELTYGTGVSWYKNIMAVGRCVVIYMGAEHEIDRIEPCTVEAGLAAFGNPRAIVLRLLRRHEFRVLHEATKAS
jgi:hypothetical protein